jgi:hypothetical protein
LTYLFDRPCDWRGYCGLPRQADGSRRYCKDVLPGLSAPLHLSSAIDTNLLA